MNQLGYTTKVCRTCGEEKHITDFYLHSTGKDGYRNNCKTCCLEKMKENRDPVKRKAYIKQYYENNKNYIKEKSRKYREENLERVRETNKKYSESLRKIDPEAAKLRARGYALKRKYGITLEQYDELLEKQNGSCAICSKHSSTFKTALAVDHDHRTGRIRGLLCTHCNYRMVAKHRDGDLLRKIADYIEQGTDWYVPEKKKKKRKSNDE